MNVAHVQDYENFRQTAVQCLPNTVNTKYDNKTANDMALFTNTDLKPVSFPNIFYEDFYDEYETLKNSFIDTLKAYVSKHVVLDSYNDRLKNSISFYNNVIKKTAFMTEQVTDRFSEILEYTKKNAGSFSGGDQEIKIINGIYETIDIKVQSLNAFFNEFNEKMETLGNEDLYSYINNINMDKHVDNLFNQWKLTYNSYINPGTESLRSVSVFFKKAVLGIKADIDRDINRKLTNFVENVKKADTRFKREALLFELSTFEEVLGYSISKLEDDSSCDNIREYAKTVRSISQGILEIIEGCGISVIAPMPHDMFNGKEHEVLMANITEGFKKGEVVKVINSGYREGDTVYIRANVICAR
jgi:molecular chaperone GrpE (heat shock protein)